MSTVPKQLLTPAEYLARERAAEYKSEYYRGEMFAMAGASLAHGTILSNLCRATGNQLEGGPCRIVITDLRVKVKQAGLYTYPDAVIYCGEPQLEDDKFDTLLNPQVIVEVLSDSTESYVRGKKFELYRQSATLREYILITQDRALVERFVRQDDETWVLATFSDLTATFAYGTLPVQIPLSTIYDGVKLAEQQ